MLSVGMLVGEFDGVEVGKNDGEKEGLLVG
jgi:hypothetical protein